MRRHRVQCKLVCKIPSIELQLYLVDDLIVDLPAATAGPLLLGRQESASLAMSAVHGREGAGAWSQVVMSMTPRAVVLGEPFASPLATGLRLRPTSRAQSHTCMRMSNDHA